MASSLLKRGIPFAVQLIPVPGLLSLRLFPLLFSAIAYFCGLGIGKFRTNLWFTKGLLAVSLSTNLGLLFFFKYLNFFGETLTAPFLF